MIVTCLFCDGVAVDDVVIARYAMAANSASTPLLVHLSGLLLLVVFGLSTTAARSERKGERFNGFNSALTRL